MIPRAAYSPDLALCEYFLKKWMGGKRFRSNEDDITKINAYFEGLEKNCYSKAIKNEKTMD